jgi:hypothetical protein
MSTVLYIVWVVKFSREGYEIEYRISEWEEFQVWKFFHLQKLAHGKKSLPPKGHRPAQVAVLGPRKARLFFPRANFKVKFPCLNPQPIRKLYSCKSQPSDLRYRNFSMAIACIDSYRNRFLYFKEESNVFCE